MRVSRFIERVTLQETNFNFTCINKESYRNRTKHCQKELAGEKYLKKKQGPFCGSQRINSTRSCNKTWIEVERYASKVKVILVKMNNLIIGYEFDSTQTSNDKSKNFIDDFVKLVRILAL